MNRLNKLFNKPISQTINHIYARVIKRFFSKYYFYLIDRNRKKAISLNWKDLYGKSFPWNNPITLNEKITYLSGITDTSLWTKYADKYEVRQYVKDCGCEEILVRCYGIWDKIENVEWDKLPQSFVIKCTHDCGSTIIIKDKEKELDINKMNEFYTVRLQKRFGYNTCEPHYTKIKPRIMVEELIEIETIGFTSSSMVDYKFWCIRGNVPCCMVVYDRYAGKYVLDLYTIPTWKQTEFGLIERYSNRFKQQLPAPKNLDKMIEIAKKLSKEIPVVRVDLYNVNGKIYFGEMTFTSQAGHMEYYTEEFQKEMGEMITL